MAGTPDSKVHVSQMGPTWVLSAPGRPHVGPMNLAIVMSHRPRYQAEAGDLSDRPKTTCALAPHYGVTVVSPIANTYSDHG